MIRKRINGKFIELTEQEISELNDTPLEDDSYQTDSVHQLVEGLSTATTIAQIRAVAKSILDETEGDAL